MQVSTFAITSKPETSVDLDAKRQASVSFTVTNTSGQNLRGRANLKFDDGSKLEWFTLPDPERDFAVDATENYPVTLKAPPGAPPGDHRFQLQMVGVKNPDEMAAESGWIAWKAPAAVTKPFPWIWLIIPVAVLLLAAIGGGVWYWLNHMPKPEQVAAVSVAQKDPTDFGSIQVNSTSAAKVVKLKNTGSKEAQVTLTLGGAAAADFKIAAETCTSAKLAPNGGECEIHAGFAPKTLGDKQAELDIAVDSGKTPAAVLLTGTGQGVSAVCVSPAPIYLGFTYTGTTPPTSGSVKPISIANCGTAPLLVTGTSITGDASSINHFAKTSDNCGGVTLQPSQACSVSLQFSVTFDNFTFSASLVVLDNSAGNPHQFPISGSRTKCSTKFCYIIVPQAQPIYVIVTPTPTP